MHRRTSSKKFIGRKKELQTLDAAEFVPDYSPEDKAISVIELGHGDTYYEKVVKPDLHNYMGKVFEDMCCYYTLKEGISGKFGCFITQTGNWWGMKNISDSKLS